MDRHLDIPNCDGEFDICWDDLGIPHVYAATVADAFRGMGYVEGYERLWQIHLSCLYANGNAASVFGERFVRQDLLHRAFDVPAARLGIPDSPGDWIVDAYLDGLNACVASLDLEEPTAGVRRHQCDAPPIHACGHRLATPVHKLVPGPQLAGEDVPRSDHRAPWGRPVP